MVIGVLLALCSQQVSGVEIYSRKLNSDNGLPDNNVRSLAQDAQGFIWMGTPDGLYRFDGYFYTSYKYGDNSQSRLLNNNHISGIYALPTNQMLIAEQGGMFSVFDVDSNRFVDMEGEDKRQMYDNCRRVRVNSQTVASYKSIIDHGGGVINDNLGNVVVLDNTGLIWHIDRLAGETVQMRVFDADLFLLIRSKKYVVVTSEKNQLIWVSTNGCGITVYDRRNKSIQLVRQSSGLISTDYIQDMCLDKDDNVWVADEFHGVVLLATKRSAAMPYLLNEQSKNLRDNQVYVMHWMTDSTLLLTNTKGDVYQADRQMNIRLMPQYEGIDIHSVCNDGQGQLWIGTRQQGLRAGGGQWYVSNPNEPTLVSGNNIYYLLCDREGRVWVAVDDSYLNMAVRQADGSYSFRYFLMITLGHEYFAKMHAAKYG